MLTYIIISCLITGVASVLAIVHANHIVRPIGRHRGTPGQLMLQSQVRAERERAYNLAIVKEWAPEHGIRADWKLV